MKIAITSSNGKTVDTHFGKASKFYIYDLLPTSSKYIEERSAFRYCSGVEGHAFNSIKFDAIYELIKDCEILCTVKIGNKPASKLLEKGINIVESEGDLNKIFQNTNWREMKS